MVTPVPVIYLLAVVLETESASYDDPEPPPDQNTGGTE
jgi:hypothetical protein